MIIFSLLLATDQVKDQGSFVSKYQLEYIPLNCDWTATRVTILFSFLLKRGLQSSKKALANGELHQPCSRTIKLFLDKYLSLVLRCLLIIA